MRRYSLGGTSPRNTSVSVPRLTALCTHRTRTSSAAGGARASSRNSARPGSEIQQALAVSDTVASDKAMAMWVANGAHVRRRRAMVRCAR
jgi:hypothetical protein